MSGSVDVDKETTVVSNYGGQESSIIVKPSSQTFANYGSRTQPISIDKYADIVTKHDIRVYDKKQTGKAGETTVTTSYRLNFSGVKPVYSLLGKVEAFGKNAAKKAAKKGSGSNKRIKFWMTPFAADVPNVMRASQTITLAAAYLFTAEENTEVSPGNVQSMAWVKGGDKNNVVALAKAGGFKKSSPASAAGKYAIPQQFASEDVVCTYTLFPWDRNGQDTKNANMWKSYKIAETGEEVIEAVTCNEVEGWTGTVEVIGHLESFDVHNTGGNITRSVSVHVDNIIFFFADKETTIAGRQVVATQKREETSGNNLLSGLTPEQLADLMEILKLEKQHGPTAGLLHKLRGAAEAATRGGAQGARPAPPVASSPQHHPRPQGPQMQQGYPPTNQGMYPYGQAPLQPQGQPGSYSAYTSPF